MPSKPNAALRRVATTAGTNDGRNVYVTVIDELHEWIAPKAQHEWLSAQNVRKALNTAGRPAQVGMWDKEDDTDADDGDDSGRLRGLESLNYAEFVPPIIAAIQQLTRDVRQLQAT